MAKITVDELVHVSDMWQKTYMSTMVTAKMAGAIEINGEDALTIDAPLTTIKPAVILPFGCKRVKGLAGSMPAYSYQVHVVTEPIENHQITHGGMATSLYRDLHSGLRRLGMMLQNLSAQEVRIPTKTVIGNVQAANFQTCWHPGT